MYNDLTSIELFAGAGGLALGLDFAGFRPVALIENDKSACKTLKHNKLNWNVIEEDIVGVAEKGIDKYLHPSLLGVLDNIDLLSGGFPCQSFSYAGKRLGLNDTRGTLFYSYAKILNQVKPKMFLAENVKGLLTLDKGKAFETIYNTFEDMGYKIFYKVLNAFDYFVPQKRERLFIVGIRNDIYKKYKKEFIFPTPSVKKRVLKDALKDIDNSETLCAKYSKTKEEMFKLVPEGGNWRDLPEDVAKEYMKKSYYSGGGKTGIAKRLAWDEPSPTILCSPSQKQTERCHPSENRPLSVRESARLQTFPDYWKFKGSMTSQYKQVGNAVPVRLAYVIGKSIFEYLLETYYNK